MNCCNAYGQCTQGADCAGRTSLNTGYTPPAQSEQAALQLDTARFSAALHAMLQAPAAPMTSQPVQDTTPHEAGNVWFVDSELSPPDELNGAAPDALLTRGELIKAMLAIVLIMGIWVSGLFTVADYVFGPWLSGFVTHATAWLVLP